MFLSINSPPAGIMKQIPQRKNVLLLSNLLYHLHILLSCLYVDGKGFCSLCLGNGRAVCNFCSWGHSLEAMEAPGECCTFRPTGLGLSGCSNPSQALAVFLVLSRRLCKHRGWAVLCGMEPEPSQMRAAQMVRAWC